ncbi:hypothetical protein EQ875_01531 [Photobacterium damselae subsp. damselae]|nr:transposase [Photobacterium damselae]TGZ35252.1 hypothetical protein EQ875_01531 [Photobacterium damselae subsp. damselae]
MEQGGNYSRNGYYLQSFITDDGTIPIDVPRDRDAPFDPKIVKKHQTRFQSIVKWSVKLATDLYSLLNLRSDSNRNSGVKLEHIVLVIVSPLTR